MANGWNLAIVYGDRHTAILDKRCDSILKSVIKKYKHMIKYIVDLGDGVDNPFMSQFPVDPDFVMTSQQEFDLYAEHLNQISKIVPDAKIIIIPCNHGFSRLSNSKKINRGVDSLRGIKFENVLKDSIVNNGGSIKNIEIADMNYKLKLTKDNNVLFTHGDPRIDPNVKGGVSGARRTAAEYPFEGDIIMGHGHEFKFFPRTFKGKFLAQLDMMASIKEMESHYVGWHPYSNGFAMIFYNKKLNMRIFNRVQIVDGRAFIDGKEFNGNKH